MLRIFIDNKIPFIRGILENYAEVRYFNPSCTLMDVTDYAKEIISQKDLKKADILVVRTRTKCTDTFLEGSDIKCIVTATIGTDHIDLKYCCNHGIKVFSVAGCNSGGVMQYVFTCLYYFAHINHLDLKKKTLGVVGVGNVGSKVAGLGEALGFKVMRNDPYKVHEPGINYYELDELCRECDVISFHVPLTEQTKGMIDDNFLASLKLRPIIINSSRGDVVKQSSLFSNRDRISGLILDVWPGEPDLDKDLLAMADIATPHIAGYSLEGKINGTVMSIRNVAEFAGYEELKNFSAPSSWYGSLRQVKLDANASQIDICKQFLDAFPVYEIDRLLRESPANFETIRSDYDYRREICVNFMQ